MLPLQTAALVKLSILIFLNVCKADDLARGKRYAHGYTREKDDNGLVKDIETIIVTDALQRINIPVDLTKMTKRSYEQTGCTWQRKHVPTYGYLIIEGESNGLSDSGSIHEVELDNPNIVDDESKVLSNRFKREVHSVNYKGYTPTYLGYLRKATASAAGVTSGAPTYMANADRNYTSTKLNQGYHSMRHKRHLLQHTATRRSVPFYGYYLRKKGIKENTGVLEAQDGQIVKGEAGNPKIANVKETETENKYLHSYYGVKRGKRSPLFYNYYLRKKLDKTNTGVLDAQDGQIVKAETGNPNVANVAKTETEKKYIHNYYGIRRSKRSPIFYGYYLRKKEDKKNTWSVNAQDGHSVHGKSGNSRVGNEDKTETENKYIHNYYGVRNKRSPVFYGYYLRKKDDKANTGVLDAQDGQIAKAAALNPNIANVVETKTNNKYLHNYYGVRSKRSPIVYGYYLRKKLDKANTGLLSTQDGQIVSAALLNPSVANVEDPKSKNKHLHSYYGLRIKRSPVSYGHFLRKKEKDENTGFLVTQDGQIVKAVAGNLKFADVKETDNKILQGYRAHRV